MVIQINSRIIDIVNNLIHIRLKKTLTGISTIIGSSSRFFLSQHVKAVLYIKVVYFRNLGQDNMVVYVEMESKTQTNRIISLDNRTRF
jgi:hypothetical protein